MKYIKRILNYFKGVIISYHCKLKWFFSSLTRRWGYKLGSLFVLPKFSDFFGKETPSWVEANPARRFFNFKETFYFNKKYKNFFSNSRFKSLILNSRQLLEDKMYTVFPLFILVIRGLIYRFFYTGWFFTSFMLFFSGVCSLYLFYCIKTTGGIHRFEIVDVPYNYGVEVLFTSMLKVKGHYYPYMALELAWKGGLWGTAALPREAYVWTLRGVFWCSFIHGAFNENLRSTETRMEEFEHRDYNWKYYFQLFSIHSIWEELENGEYELHYEDFEETVDWTFSDYKFDMVNMPSLTELETFGDRLSDRDSDGEDYNVAWISKSYLKYDSRRIAETRFKSTPGKNSFNDVWEADFITLKLQTRDPKANIYEKRYKLLDDFDDYRSPEMNEKSLYMFFKKKVWHMMDPTIGKIFKLNSSFMKPRDDIREEYSKRTMRFIFDPTAQLNDVISAIFFVLLADLHIQPFQKNWVVLKRRRVHDPVEVIKRLKKVKSKAEFNSLKRLLKPTATYGYRGINDKIITVISSFLPTPVAFVWFIISLYIYHIYGFYMWFKSYKGAKKHGMTKRWQIKLILFVQLLILVYTFICTSFYGISATVWILNVIVLSWININYVETTFWDKMRQRRALGQPMICHWSNTISFDSENFFARDNPPPSFVEDAPESYWCYWRTPQDWDSFYRLVSLNKNNEYHSRKASKLFYHFKGKRYNRIFFGAAKEMLYKKPLTIKEIIRTGDASKEAYTLLIIQKVISDFRLVRQRHDDEVQWSADYKVASYFTTALRVGFDWTDDDVDGALLRDWIQRKESRNIIFLSFGEFDSIRRRTVLVFLPLTILYLPIWFIIYRYEWYDKLEFEMTTFFGHEIEAQRTLLGQRSWINRNVVFSELQSLNKNRATRQAFFETTQAESIIDDCDTFVEHIQNCDAYDFWEFQQVYVHLELEDYKWSSSAASSDVYIMVEVAEHLADCFREAEVLTVRKTDQLECIDKFVDFKKNIKYVHETYTSELAAKGIIHKNAFLFKYVTRRFTPVFNAEVTELRHYSRNFPLYQFQNRFNIVDSIWKKMLPKFACLNDKNFGNQYNDISFLLTKDYGVEKEDVAFEIFKKYSFIVDENGFKSRGSFSLTGLEDDATKELDLNFQFFRTYSGQSFLKTVSLELSKDVIQREYEKGTNRDILPSLYQKSKLQKSSDFYIHDKFWYLRPISGFNRTLFFKLFSKYLHRKSYRSQRNRVLKNSSFIFTPGIAWWPFDYAYGGSHVIANYYKRLYDRKKPKSNKMRRDPYKFITKKLFIWDSVLTNFLKNEFLNQNNTSFTFNSNLEKLLLKKFQLKYGNLEDKKLNFEDFYSIKRYYFNKLNFRKRIIFSLLGTVRSVRRFKKISKFRVQKKIWRQRGRFFKRRRYIPSLRYCEKTIQAVNFAKQLKLRKLKKYLKPNRKSLYKFRFNYSIIDYIFKTYKKRRLTFSLKKNLIDKGPLYLFVNRKKSVLRSHFQNKNSNFRAGRLLAEKYLNHFSDYSTYSRLKSYSFLTAFRDKKTNFFDVSDFNGLRHFDESSIHTKVLTWLPLKPSLRISHINSRISEIFYKYDMPKVTLANKITKAKKKIAFFAKASESYEPPLCAGYRYKRWPVKTTKEVYLKVFKKRYLERKPTSKVKFKLLNTYRKASKSYDFIFIKKISYFKNTKLFKPISFEKLNKQKRPSYRNFFKASKKIKCISLANFNIVASRQLNFKKSLFNLSFINLFLYKHKR